MENLTARYEGNTVVLGSLEDGKSVNAWFTVGSLGPLTVEFEQKSSPFISYQIADYDPAQNHSDGLKLCLTIQPKLIQRSVEDDETRTPLQVLLDRVGAWIRADLGVSEPRPN